MKGIISGNTKAENDEAHNDNITKDSNVTEAAGSCSNYEPFLPIESDYEPFPVSESEYEPDDDSDDSDDSPVYSPLTPLRKKKLSLKKNSGRKRKAFPEEWTRCKAKKSLNYGLKHTTGSGREKPARQMKNSCSCPLKCFEKFSSEERQKIFDKFWETGDKTMQWQFILENSRTLDKKTCTINPKKQRNIVRKYYFKKISSNKEIQEVQICQKMFMNTLDINKQWITTAFKKSIQGEGILTPDQRGRHKRPVNELKETIKSQIRSHIISFPAVESHYVRQSSSKKFLSPDLNIAKMYRLFCQKISEGNLNINVSQRQYHDIFVGEFNIAFHKPRKDQCNICTVFQNLDDNSKQKQYEAHQQHLNNKNFVRNLKEQDKEKSKQSNGKVKVVCYDFQKQLPCPHADTNIFYYRRNFLTYNFTLFELGSKDTTCFVWDESLAGKGATEVTSCLNYYLKQLKDTNEVIFYSDNCPSQNKNKIVFSFYAWATKTYNMKIVHRFLEQGHTQNEADSVHANIEKEKKGKKIYVPNQWYTLIQCSRKSGKPYNVVEMPQENFYNFKDLVETYHLDKDINNQKILWNKIREILVSPNEPNKIRFKYNLSDEYNVLDITHKKRKKKVETFNLKQKYTSMLPISEAKFNDMKFLCTNNYIPNTYHSFYNQLTYSNISDNFVDLSDEN